MKKETLIKLLETLDNIENVEVVKIKLKDGEEISYGNREKEYISYPIYLDKYRGPYFQMWSGTDNITIGNIPESMGYNGKDQTFRRTEYSNGTIVLCNKVD